MINEPSSELILAAEDFEIDLFKRVHYFSEYEERIIRKLVAHGPVLLRGGRGSGKSALLREAAERLNSSSLSESAFGVYLSLRHLPLLRSAGREYETTFCRLLIDRINQLLSVAYEDETFSCEPEVSAMHSGLASLAQRLSRRIVLVFDDAAHIGRERSLVEFFDIFRTISGSYVSCKAAIYPGVTRFGRRFDVLNDATVVDLTRNEDSDTFSKFFESVAIRRFGRRLTERNFTRDLHLEEAASFVGRAVIGNVRAFVYVWGRLVDKADDAHGSTIGFPQLGEVMISTASEYFWPLFDELRPKLGMYEPLIDPATNLATVLYEAASKGEGSRAVLVHRDHVERLSRLFEVLEYTGFISRREASRGMKSGGRGTRFVMNLCNLLEQVRGSRLTRDLFVKWNNKDAETVEIHRGVELLQIAVPELNESAEPAILSMPITKLVKSQTYPYGLTEQKISVLVDDGIETIGDLANTSDAELDALKGIGTAWVQRIRNVVAQAVWM